jgi:CRP/FNR family transcriptional regulator, cyclic AMP receptor protein
MQAQPPADFRLPPSLLASLASCGVVRSFPAQTILINEGDTSQSVYIVLAGRVKVYTSGDDGRVFVLSELLPGEYLGELSIDGEPRSASVQTLEPTRCRIVQRAEWAAFLAEQPAFAAHLTHKLMHQVRQLTEQVRALALRDVYARVAHLLIELSEPAGAQRILRHRLTQQDIADRVGASREMVNRVMKELTAGGYVATDGDRRLVLCKTLPARW